MSDNDITVPVALSGRHVHLSQEHVDALFGSGYQLNWLSDLSQPGQYACRETVEVMGPKRSFSKVRVLGPVRKETQVELSTTDGVMLGINLPTRDSGDIKGTPGAYLIGPRGAIKIHEGCIVASRHIHTTPEDAQRLGVHDKQKVWVQIEGARGLIFSDVLIRVSPDFKTELHLDLDEGNAASIRNGDQGRILSNICSDLCQLKQCGISSDLRPGESQPFCQFTSSGWSIR
ncbi:MAG: phosphate propanoyltransferase [Deltaproteobacteria bacterium]|nr:phosphate propanoyltransferase [Deltaproteobacteria bacterium]